VASLITKQGQAAKILVQRLTPIVEDRLRKRTLTSSLPEAKTVCDHILASEEDFKLMKLA
jgi:hypothetical protein